MTVNFMVKVKHRKVVVTGGGAKAPDGNAKVRPGTRIRWRIHDANQTFSLKFEDMVYADSAEDPPPAWPFAATPPIDTDGNSDEANGTVSGATYFEGVTRDADLAFFQYTASIPTYTSTDEYQSDEPVAATDPVIIIERRR